MQYIINQKFKINRDLYKTSPCQVLYAGTQIDPSAGK